jgi:quinol monooxygenase YgiN
MLVYIDTSEVRVGALEELKAAVEELVEFLDANVDGPIAYNVYFSDDGTQMTVVHIHPDSASLENHLKVGGPAFQRFADLLTLSSIRVYGEPSENAIRQLHDKADLLGCTDVSVYVRHAGFGRLGSTPQ